MPRQIVRDYGKLYSDYFMIPSLRNFRQNMVVQAFDDEGNGFKDRYITLNLNAKSHQDILAACISMRSSENQVETCIVVSDTLAKLPKQEQKEYLAHEWIHAMMAFREEDRKDLQGKTLSGQPETAIYGYLITSNSVWQDDEQTSKEIKSALEHLLVPDELVTRTLYKDFNKDIRKLCDYSNKDDNFLGTIEIVTEFARIFSSKYFVAPELAIKRLIEMIFKDRQDASFLSLKKDFWSITLTFE